MIVESKLKKSLLGLLVALVTYNHSFPILKNIKNTYSILNDEYKSYSLVHGAVAWETGIVRNMYDFGQIFPKFGKDQEGRKIIIGYENLGETSKLVRVIHALFHRVNPDSTSPADFDVSGQLNSENTEEIAILVAEICIQISKIKPILKNINDLTSQRLSSLQKNELKDYLKDLKALDNIPGEKKKFLANKKPFKEEEMALNQLILWVESITDLKKATTNFESLYKKIKIDTLSSQGTQFLIEYIKLVDLLKKLFNQTQTLKWELVAPAVIGSINECDINNQNVLYPEHMIEIVLLSFLYKKCSDNRKALRTFYRVLHQKTDNNALNRELSDDWLNDVYKNTTKQEAIEQVERIVTQKAIDKNFEDFTYYSLQISGLNASNYGAAVYEYEPGRSVRFSDCMENSILNFILLLSYNQIKNTFDLDTLCSRLKKDKSELNQKLVDFYNNISSVSDVHLKKIHNLWADLVSNIPYVAYKQITSDPDAIAHDKGYISISNSEPEKTKLDLSTLGYQVIPQANVYKYNMRPTIKNLIVVVNYLLNLDLFSNNQPELTNKDFIKNHFHKLCKTLNIHADECFIAQDKSAAQSDIVNVDQASNQNINLYLTFKISEESSFRLNTTPGHAEPEIIEKSVDLMNKLNVIYYEILNDPDINGKMPQPTSDFIIAFQCFKIKTNLEQPSVAYNLQEKNVYAALFTLPLTMFSVNNYPYPRFSNNYASIIPSFGKCLAYDVFLRAFKSNGSSDDDIAFQSLSFIKDRMSRPDMENKKVLNYINMAIKKTINRIKNTTTPFLSNELISTLHGLARIGYKPNPEEFNTVFYDLLNTANDISNLVSLKELLNLKLDTNKLIQLASDQYDSKQPIATNKATQLWRLLLSDADPDVVVKSSNQGIKSVQSHLNDRSMDDANIKLLWQIMNTKNPDLFVPIARAFLNIYKESDREEDRIAYALGLHMNHTKKSIFDIAEFKEYIESAEKSGDQNLVRKAEKLKNSTVDNDDA